MTEKELIVLDFDGVIVDGIKEYWASSRQTCLNILSSHEKKNFLPNEIPTTFKTMRPWVHHGWEMVLLAAECSDKTSQLNLKGIENFSKNYSRECSAALSRWGWTSSQLQEALNQTRREAISSNFNQWLNQHQPFPSVVQRLQILEKENIEFAVLTTKSIEFTKKLLNSFNLQPKLIFGHESGSKVDVLSQLLHKRIIRAFIEDRRSTLEKVLEDPKLRPITCYLASWGYLKPQDKKNLPPGIKLLNLEILRESISNWP